MSDISDAGQIVTQLHCRIYPTWGSEGVDIIVVIYRDFVSTCKEGLDLNGKLILTDQKEYHESLKQGFLEITERLSELLGEKVSLKRFY